MKKLLALLCLTFSLFAFTASASAESYILAIHGATYRAPAAALLLITGLVGIAALRKRFN